MTSIINRHPAATAASFSVLPKLGAGQQIEATVLGSTRRGLSVLIGQERFQLETSSRLAGATTLTLQGLSSSVSEKGRPVQIVASDARSLATPILAKLTSGSEPEAPSPDAIVRRGLISVVGQPVTFDGRALGEAVTLHLTTAGPATAAAKDATAMSAPVPATTEGGATAADRQAGAYHVPQRQSMTGDAPLGSERGSNRGAVNVTSPSPAAEAGRSTGIGASARATSLFFTADGVAQPSITNRAVPPSASRAFAASSPTSEGPGPSFDMRRSIGSGADTERDLPLTATVERKTQQGGVILKAGDRYFRLEQPIDLPPGSSLQVSLVSTMSVAGRPNSQSDLEGTETRLARLIGILDDIDLAGRKAGEVDQQGLTRQLPLPDKQLASKFLAFLSMTGGGDVHGQRSSPSSGQTITNSVMGEQVQTLIRELGTLASESLSEGWKSITLPFGSDPSQAVAHYYRDHVFDPDDETAHDDAERMETQRAVFDVSFSRLGRCQIDALCQDRRFDLLIRSEHPFPEQDRQEMTVLFAQACDVSDLHGDIGFKAGEFFEPARKAVGRSDLQT